MDGIGGIIRGAHRKIEYFSMTLREETVKGWVLSGTLSGRPRYTHPPVGNPCHCGRAENFTTPPIIDELNFFSSKKLIFTMRFQRYWN